MNPPTSTRPQAKASSRTRLGAPRPPDHALRNRGFTLIELLVAMVVFGFIVAIMSTAFSQVSQIVRVASESGNSFQPRWVQVRALHDAIGNLTFSDSADPAFVGDATSLRFITLASPMARAGVAQQVDLKLEPSTDRRTTDMLVSASAEPLADRFEDAVSRATDAKPVQWVNWGEPVEFRFLDREGTEHTTWPPLGKAQDPLPAAVLVRGRDRDRTLWRSAVFEGVARQERSVDAIDFLNRK